jgi:aryl-alcohol dehydrogenase-like predicted oxidoreductase
MELRQLGQTDILISPIVFGTWQAGKRGWVGVEEGEVMAAMRAAVDLGVTTFDTAEIYGDGYAEELVGRALVDVRDRVVIASKVFPTHLKATQVITACEQSLRRLQTDVIDLYQVHWPAGAFNSQRIPIGETMTALTQLQDQGKIRAIGVSNFSRQQLAEAMTYGRIDSLQPPYSLFWRGAEAEQLPYCVEHQLTLLAYSSLAQGLLTGKFGPGHHFPAEDIRSQNRLFQPPLYDQAQIALAQLQPIAERYQISLGNLALAWLIAQPQTVAIVGARNSDQARNNARAAEVTLSPEDLQAMDRISRLVSDRVGPNPVMWDFPKPRRTPPHRLWSWVQSRLSFLRR